MSDRSGFDLKKAEPYWYDNPKVLFSAPSADQRSEFEGGEQISTSDKLKNAFLPEKTLGMSHPANFNRITRISILVAVILSIVLQSWWPVAIAAGIMTLVLLISYGLLVQKTREERERHSKEYCDTDDGESFFASNALSAAMDMPESPPESQVASIFIPPEFSPSVSDSMEKWGTSSYVPNEMNPTSNWPTTSSMLGEQQEKFEKTSPPVVVGMDPKNAPLGSLTLNYQRPQNLSGSYLSSMGVGVPVEDVVGEQPQTQTEKMLSKMYMDKNQYGWDETVAKRAPDWRCNPNDSRNRKALEQKELEKQSFRGLSWGMGP